MSRPHKQAQLRTEGGEDAVQSSEVETGSPTAQPEPEAGAAAPEAAVRDAAGGAVAAAGPAKKKQKVVKKQCSIDLRS